MLLEGILCEERLVCERFSSSSLLNGIITPSAILTVGEVWFSANRALEMGANPVFRLDFLHGFSGLNAIIARLVVFRFEMFPTSAKSAYRRARLLTRKTSFCSSILVLHARFVLAGELPA